MKGLAVSLTVLLAFTAILVTLPNTESAALTSNGGRIINGNDAERGQFPWQVALHMKVNETHGRFCGGSIIASQWVLTAVHCLENITYVDLRFGVLELNKTEDGSVKLRSESFIFHENYTTLIINGTDSGVVLNDIALIRLPTPLNWSDIIRPVKLARRSQQVDLLFGKSVTASGWGLTELNENGELADILQFVELEVLVTGNCSEVGLICTEFSDSAAYNGDSGGPLVWKDDDGVYQLEGVTSMFFKENNTQPRRMQLYNTFTSVPHFLDWIAAKTGIEIED